MVSRKKAIAAARVLIIVRPNSSSHEPGLAHPIPFAIRLLEVSPRARAEQPTLTVVDMT
jgi:hypothetical protein